MYIPPYSPNHNPIKNLFSVIKDTYYKLDKTEINNKQLDSSYYDYYTKIDETYYKKIFERSINFNHENIH